MTRESMKEFAESWIKTSTRPPRDQDDWWIGFTYAMQLVLQEVGK